MPDELQTVSPEESDPRSSSTLIVGAVGIVLLVVVGILLEVLYYDTAETEFQRKIVAEQPQQLRLLQAEQRERLNRAEVPIEDAMKLVVESAKSDPSHVTGSALPVFAR